MATLAGKCSRFTMTMASVLLLTAMNTGAGAQVCGDADGNGDVRINDGVRVLRAAAFLSTTCPPRVCDVNARQCQGGTRAGFRCAVASECPGGSCVLAATPGIDISDGLATLRHVASLDPPPTGCVDQDVTMLIDQVEGSQGQAPMMVGVAPIPGAGAPNTVNGDCTPGGGGGCAETPHDAPQNMFVSLPFGGIATAATAPVELGPLAAPAGGTAVTCDHKLLVAVPRSICVSDPAQPTCIQDSDCSTGSCNPVNNRVGTCTLLDDVNIVSCVGANGTFDESLCTGFGSCLTFTDGFYELPLATCSEPGLSAELANARALISAQVPSGKRFYVDVATCCDNVLSNYARFDFEGN